MTPFPPLRPDDGAPTFATLRSGALLDAARSRDASQRAAESLSRAAVRGRREGLSTRVIAERLEISQGTIRRFLAADDGVFEASR